MAQPCGAAVRAAAGTRTRIVCECAGALPVELLPLPCVAADPAWLDSSGWLPRVYPHSPEPSDDCAARRSPSVHWFGCSPGTACPASRNRGACCAGGQLADGYSLARLVRFVLNKARLLEFGRTHTIADRTTTSEQILPKGCTAGRRSRAERAARDGPVSARCAGVRGCGGLADRDRWSNYGEPCGAVGY